MNDKSFGGFATTSDGQHVTLTGEQANEFWEAAQREKEQRSVDMPDTLSALAQINRAENRLHDLGWQDGVYCPKNSSEFACIQFGSRGIFTGFYQGEWPSGRVYVCDYLVHPSQLMWKEISNLSNDEREHLENCMGEDRKAHERELEMYASMDQMTDGD